MAHDRTIQVDVHWREIPILSDVVLEVEEAEGFLPTASPMPVGTMLVVNPVRSKDVRVPARITQISEIGGSSARERGMMLAFEAAGEQLLDFADDSRARESESDSAPEVAAEPPAFDEDSVPAGPSLSQNSGEYVEIVTITSPEPEDQDVKDSGLASHASGEIQLEAAASGDDPEAPDKVIIDVAEVPTPQQGAAPDEDEEADVPEEELETVVERPSGLRAAEEDDSEEDEDEESEGKRRKRRRGRGKRRKKKR